MRSFFTFILTVVLTIFMANSAAAQTGGDAIIYPEKYMGKKVEHFYFDVKNGADKVHTTSFANDLYVADDMNGIRIPIYGDDKHPAHPSAGVVVESYYESIIKSIEFSRTARIGKDYYVFASKKLDGQNSFPAWTKNANGVIVTEYVKLLTDFLLYMKDKGIEIDYLGIQNEEEFNEGNITPAKHKAIVDSLRDITARNGLKMPKIVGYEGYGPNKNNWVRDLKNAGWLDRMDVYGTHYYPHLRPNSKLLADLALIGDMPFWSTEPHWDSKAEVDDWKEAEEGICALWDQLDAGMSGVMWWAYKRSGSLRGNLMRTFTVPLKDATLIDMIDIDGRGTATYGKLQTRAVRKDNTITVWAVNNHATTSYQNYGFKLYQGAIVGNVSYRRWIKNQTVEGVTGTATIEGNNTFRVTIPAQSIFSFSFNYDLFLASTNVTNSFTDLKVTPSVATDHILISGISEGNRYQIFDLAGKLQTTSLSLNVDISLYRPGIYIVKAYDGRTTRFVKK
jgi:O-glycosyl hydrolase